MATFGGPALIAGTPLLASILENPLIRVLVCAAFYGAVWCCGRWLRRNARNINGAVERVHRARNWKVPGGGWIVFGLILFAYVVLTYLVLKDPLVPR